MPNACTASVWNTMPCALQWAASSGTGCTVPISLFTHITEASATSSPSAARASSSFTAPDRSTGSIRSAAPSAAALCTLESTALCSMGVVATAVRPLPLSTRQPPRMARLSASVPPEVKQTSSFAAPRHAATRSRASSRAVRASRPQRCVLEGLPKRGPWNGAIASSTSGRTGVVAAWSR
ncbi:MAG: hypothetical protein U9Q74_12635 [Gemmatimonadota bacterium]|nr:hypothetical protein [Gemmatimonadota bacterium]